MNTTPEILTASSASDACHQVLNELLMRWPEQPSDALSSALLDHLCQCRSCLRRWIALEAAADLASFPDASSDSDLAGIDISVVRPANSHGA